MQAVKIPINLIDQNQLSPNEMSPEGFHKLRDNLKTTGQYPSLIVMEKTDSKDKRYILLDGHHRLAILKDLSHTEAWCEIWEVSAQQADILLATLNRLRGVDDTQKRARLVNKLWEEYDGDMELLARLLPESEKSLESFLKIADREVEDVLKELDTDRGLLTSRLAQVVDQDAAEKMANLYSAGFDDKMKLTFVFKNEIDYYRAMEFFGRKPDVEKLMEIVYEIREGELVK